jgi:hypothetical protein
MLSRWLAWFVDDDDPLYSPWRGVALWLLVVGLIVVATLAASHFGWDDSSGSGSCPPAWTSAGDC